MTHSILAKMLAMKRFGTPLAMAQKQRATSPANTPYHRRFIIQSGDENLHEDMLSRKFQRTSGS
jgi:hypothetical protein